VVERGEGKDRMKQGPVRKPRSVT